MPTFYKDDGVRSAVFVRVSAKKHRLTFPNKSPQNLPIVFSLPISLGNVPKKAPWVLSSCPPITIPSASPSSSAASVPPSPAAPSPPPHPPPHLRSPSLSALRPRIQYPRLQRVRLPAALALRCRRGWISTMGDRWMARCRRMCSMWL